VLHQYLQQGLTLRELVVVTGGGHSIGAGNLDVRACDARCLLSVCERRARKARCRSFCLSALLLSPPTPTPNKPTPLNKTYTHTTTTTTEHGLERRVHGRRLVADP
jgi:hypothetical protein